MLALRSVTKLCICDINPVPVLRILSQNVEHCAVSTLAVALEYHPELVRSVSMGPCSTSQPVPLKAHLYTLCVHGCTQGHVADPFVVHFYIIFVFLYYDIIGQCVSVLVMCMLLYSVF